MSNNTIEIQNLYKVYKSKKEEIVANNNINFVAQEGEIIAILGPNGVGKSTFVKQIIGYLSPTSGDIKVLGESIHGMSRTLISKIGYMMQSRYSHWDHLTVKDALFYSGKLKKIPKAEINKQIEYFIDKLDLTNETNRTIGSLSGGKKQAAAIACSTIGFPEIIILDEPTNGLDPQKRILLWSFLKEINMEKNITILLITHTVNEIEDIADRVVIMGNGKILVDGTPQELKSELTDKIRIEFELEKSIGLENIEFLKEYFYTWSSDNLKLFVYTSQSDMAKLIEKVFSIKNISENIKNVQIYRPTLEDIYIKIMGQKIS
ncbi:ABC transporter ATP-binding protein [Clostridium sp. C8-1-8]|uniref:ABC transporter ATP-binding protein n=1 Tax=Clostridium sp. C8-1-8 TaxID=2698831 RepID=UPI00136DB162|nr:ABC transporter ATP-binding protein [Clostridium sp. C8-1-8]